MNTLGDNEADEKFEEFRRKFGKDFLSPRMYAIRSDWENWNLEEFTLKPTSLET